MIKSITKSLEITNKQQYLITEWFDVVITRVEWFEKVLENQSLSV